MTDQPAPTPADRHLRYRLIRYRDHRKLSQQQVADRTGITREYLSMIENGRRRLINHQLLTALAHALEVDVTALTTYHPGPVGTPPEQATTLRLHLHQLTATTETTPTGVGRVIVITDGVLRIELTPGPPHHTKQTRNGAIHIASAISAYLRHQIHRP